MARRSGSVVSGGLALVIGAGAGGVVVPSGSTITEGQLEAEFDQFMPVHTAAWRARLDRFFHQWFDTNYARGGGANRPTITGPGLAGRGFYYGDCQR